MSAASLAVRRGLRGSLYGLNRDDAEYILDTFPIVRKNDVKAHGEYRTKRVILEIYDAMAEAARTGVPYSTRVLGIVRCINETVALADELPPVYLSNPISLERAIMTTLYEEKVRCGLCGVESKYKGVGSTNASGSADLDTRPPEMKRSTIFAWVRRCPKCGYCNSDVSKSHPGSKAVTGSEEYMNQLNDPAFPELVNSFRCKAILDREGKDYGSATWALIHAAWACDDSDRPSQAMACREKAADMHMLAETERQQVAGQSGAGTAILVDLLRRSGRLHQAREVIAARRATVTEDIIVRILNFQGALIEKGDVSRHTIAEALGGRE